ncbi:MAG TPA: EF-hand domain-containing protein, partial [Ottowia sp.]|nr:EF-hand domain-containing protein [Ottowia sp.]
TLVLRPVIQATLAPVAGGMAALMGGNASAGQGGIGQASNALSMGSSLLGGVGAFGTSASWGLTNVLAGNIGSTFGGAMSMLGAGQIGSGLGALAGAAAPVLLPLMALFGSGAFSRKHAQHNLEGTFGGESGFEGNWHDYYKGGLLRSSKTVDTPLDSATLNALRGAWKAQEAMVIDYAETLGLATDKIEGFTFKINLKLKDLGDPEAAGYMDKVWQMVNEAIATGSNEMAERILGTWTTTTREVEETIKTGFWDDETFTTVKKTVEETTYAASEYAREGERAIDTLTRLATSLQATNAAFDMLGLSLYEASLAGGDMASKLIDQMGGMDAFGAQVGAYWQNYYTEAERHAYMTDKMTEALAAAGLEMPTTVAGFRALVDAQDLTTDAGRAAFTALMSVNAAFTEVYGNADAAAGSIAGLGDELAAMEPIVFGASSDLASVIEQGLLGTLTGAQLGEQMADVVMQGMYSAIAGGFSQQITALMVDGVLNPMIAAAMTGASMSAAVSQAAIDRVIQQAQAAAAAINAVLSDPGFKAAIQQVQAAVGSISVGIQRPEPIYDSYAAQNARALAAQREAERMADEAQRLAQQAAQEAQRAADEEARRQQGIMNERLGLTKQLLQLEGNTVLLRQIELEALDPSNRALQQRIWAIEDETAAAEKYKSALKDAQDFLGGFTKNIEEFIFKVSHAQADAQQSYQMAAAKFTAQMTLARGGDRDAMNGITGYADTLIGSIRRESTTGAEANLRIARVLGQLASLPKQISAEQLIVDAIVNAKTSLETVLSTNFASLDANVDGLLTADELAASGLATNTQISALMARVDANGDGMISKQELANSRLQTLFTEQCTTNTNLGNVTSAQYSTNSWLSQIQMADVGYSLSNINAINAGAGATVAAINKTNAQIGTFNRNYDNPVTAQFSADSPLYSIFRGIDETNTWLYKLHGLLTLNWLSWDFLLNKGSVINVRSENRTPANGTVFADGGYTGPGAKWEPAGVVHKGEVVWSQADVARWGGPGIVDALRQGAPGYADGGPVAVRVPQIYVPPVGRSNEETQALLREVLAELRAQRSDDR